MDIKKKPDFLLTEIAMDLLGNTFFDVDGNQLKDMECLFKENCDPTDFVPYSRNLRKVLCISDISLQAADNVDTEVIDLDIDEEDTSNVIEPNNLLSVVQQTPSAKTDSPITPALTKPPESNEANVVNPVVSDENKIIQNNEDNNVTNENSSVHKKINTSTNALHSLNQEERVKFIIELTKTELKKIKLNSAQRKHEFLEENYKMYEEYGTIYHKPTKELTKVFYAREKKMLENESDALVGFIKIVKKGEFPPGRPESVEMLRKVASDIMKAKEIMVWNPNLGE